MIEYAEALPVYAGSITKRFLLLFLIATTLLAITAATHYSVGRKSEKAQREIREVLNVKLGKEAIARNLEDVTSDLMFLARHNELKGVFDSNDRQSRDVLAKQFLVFSIQKRKYDQIRLLDKLGKEIVRVNFNNGSPAIVPEEQHQDKASRYYFTDTWSLKRNEINISPFDLNMEYGRIEMPQKPVIRFSTPMFDQKGNKSGIILLNYLGAALLRDFRRAAANISDHVMLLNSKGYWLSNPDRQDEWGFVYGNDKTFKKRFPAAWRRILEKKSGQFYNNRGMFTFTTSYPRQGRGVSNRPYGAASDRYFWKTVSHVPLQPLTTTLLAFARKNLLLYSAMLALLAIATLLIARASVKLRQAAYKSELEGRFREFQKQMIEERTRELEYTQAEKDLVVQHLIQAEKMAAIGTMASGIGHEINNPLYAILGMAEALEDEKNIETSRSYGKDILKYTREITGIVKSLSGYVRPTRAQENELADVNEALKGAIAMAKRTLLNDRIEVSQILNQVPNINASTEEIKQVFFNVIRNAIQAIEDKGKLIVSSTHNDNSVLVRIQDTGVGIPEENIGKVLDPFFTTKGPEEGEGMGLYIAHQIILKYKGSIEFGSHEYEGTVCKIEFPIARDMR